MTGMVNKMKYEIHKSELSQKICGKFQIIIGADFVPTESNYEMFLQNRTDEIFGHELSSLLKQSELTILNLEAPITTQSIPLYKVGGPNLKIYPESINVLKEFKPLLLSGANNHIRDYLDSGIAETLTLLNNAQIDTVGFGMTQVEAEKPRIYNINGLKIGCYSCSENEFCCAQNDHGGGNGYDPLNTFDAIRTLKEVVDYVIVLFHAGRENYRYPSIQLKRICHKMVDVGSSLVVCQHSHCIGAYENYKEGIIFYGQGNVLFDYVHREEWSTAILLELEAIDNTMKISVIPIQKYNNGVRIAEEDQANSIFMAFKERSRNIKNDDFVRKEWLRFLSGNQRQILLLSGVIGINCRILSAIDRIILNGKFTNLLFSRKHSQLLLNYIRCESIRESIISLLEERK